MIVLNEQIEISLLNILIFIIRIDLNNVLKPHMQKQELEIALIANLHYYYKMENV